MGKLVPVICLLGLFLAAPAQAKGPDRATITGPGLEEPSVFSGYGRDGKAPLGLLTAKGGIWIQVFGGAASGVNQGRSSRRGLRALSARGTWSSTACRGRGRGA
jgi:hypothetical protein